MNIAADRGRLHEARRRFFAGHELPEGLVAEPILRSWQRCLAQGLDVDELATVEPLTSAELPGRHDPVSKHRTKSS